ncbi:3-deoxy-D-manno-octulosonate 8-phosphate phosphatase (KDO 8-P phosphatase) [Pontimonas salivibrio]|uniref:3-deoxy-D-manno-octulosonate 8-phosphate phosphatase (KDO 8-P phosphatase) n=1 Tax=Pontimonas salivibrio TaxID=1159327 RepID=A0A2L2BNB7_9MICO|nr:HAD hydrolase family protein [Pontimonas salivibrio]AVG23165.1 3-deoxy-D-manno-octulosonate 8-phosphate phosphatase (KDO 8-P phosphatase) [Pontimonas salivibrio]
MSALDIASFQAVRLVVLDIDGVLSDGTVSIDDEDKHRRVFDIKDGLGVVRLVQSERDVVVISSSASTAGVERLRRLGIDPVHVGVSRKIDVLEAEVAKRGMDWSVVAYMGDDLPDIDCLEKAGVAVAPADAVAAVKKVANYVTTARGGRGAVRELSDLIVDGAWPGE